MVLCCRKAVECSCVVFNVEYRLAPENKIPKGTTDFYKAIKHVYNNAEQFGVEKSKICISGYSGGCLMVLGAAYMLQK